MTDTKEQRNTWINILKARVAHAQGEDFDEDRLVEMEEEVFSPDVRRNQREASPEKRKPSESNVKDKKVDPPIKAFDTDFVVPDENEDDDINEINEDLHNVAIETEEDDRIDEKESNVKSLDIK